MSTPPVLRHVGTVVAATVTAAVLYVLGRYALGLDIENPAAEPPRVTLGSVLVVSSMSSAIGWALLAALERWTSNGRTLWTRIAVGFTVVSLLGPLTTPDITAEGRALLALLHLAVAAVTIGLLLTVRSPHERASATVT